MKKAIILLVLFVAGFSLVNAQSIKKKIVDTKAQKVELTRGENPYIKVPKAVNDEQPAPEPKEENTRATYCKVWLDNYTGYTIDVYIDGDYKGTLPPWEKQYTWAIAGKTKLYAITVGGTYSWGPYYFDCDYEYTWRLH